MTQHKFSEHYSGEALNALELLLTVAREQGHVPTFSEAIQLYNKGILPHPNDYAFWAKGGSYPDARREVQKILDREKDDDDDEAEDEPTTVTPISNNNNDDDHDDFWQDPQQMTPSQ